jgi:hypothetical protein
MAEDPAAVDTRRREQEEQRRRAEAAAAAERWTSLSPQEQELELAGTSIAQLRSAFAAAKATGKYQAGSSPIEEPRRQLFQQALEWRNPEARNEAAALLREVIKWSGPPGNKLRKQQFQDWLKALES